MPFATTTLFVRRTTSALLFSALWLPTAAFAQTFGGFWEMLALSLYGAIGFFGGIAMMLFFGGLTVYYVRLGTEHRVMGIYYMIWGVKVLFFVVCTVFVLVAFVE